jgi:hypothetical protein
MTNIYLRTRGPRHVRTKARFVHARVMFHSFVFLRQLLATSATEQLITQEQNLNTSLARFEARAAVKELPASGSITSGLS